MCVVGGASASGYVCFVEMRSILDAWRLCGEWGMLRGPSGFRCLLLGPFPRVSAVRVVAMGGYVESLSFGGWG